MQYRICLKRLTNKDTGGSSSDLCFSGSVARSKKDSWSENSSIPSGLPTPILTSTTLKQPHTKLGPSEDVILQSDLDSSLTEPECGDEFSSRYVFFVVVFSPPILSL